MSSENMQQIYWRALKLKCDLNKVALAVWLRGCSPVNLLHNFRTPLKTPLDDTASALADFLN